MIKIVALLLYIYSGEVTLEQHISKNLEDCKKTLVTETKKLVKDPKFDGGMFAGCVTLKVVEANADKR